jgi:hypothetical protein
LTKQEIPEKTLSSINKDVPRSYQGNEKFLYTQPQLKRLLMAASHKSHGYVQGMNFILLYVLTICIESDRPNQKPEEVIEDMEF